jgi:hypothetical protein
MKNTLLFSLLSLLLTAVASPQSELNTPGAPAACACPKESKDFQYPPCNGSFVHLSLLKHNIHDLTKSQVRMQKPSNNDLLVNSSPPLQSLFHGFYPSFLHPPLVPSHRLESRIVPPPQ